jgi:hypothetical protein
MVTCHVIASVVLASAFALCSSHGESNEPRLRAFEAKAVCAAFAAYQSMAPKADLRHFAIWIDKEGSDYDISFVPDFGPREKPHPGGGTDYGAEVHFIVSHRTFKVLRYHFAR